MDPQEAKLPGPQRSQPPSHAEPSTSSGPPPRPGPPVVVPTGSQRSAAWPLSPLPTSVSLPEGETAAQPTQEPVDFPREPELAPLPTQGHSELARLHEKLGMLTAGVIVSIVLSLLALLLASRQ